MATYSSNTTLKISAGIAAQATASRNVGGTTDVNVYTTPANSSAWVWVRIDASGSPAGANGEVFLNASYAPFPISLTSGTIVGTKEINLYIGPSATIIARVNHPGGAGTFNTTVRVVGTLMVNSP